MIRELRDYFWIFRQWLKRLYIYPQDRIVPGAHYNYDAYWKDKRTGDSLGKLGRWQARRANLAARIISAHQGESINDIGSGAGEVLMSIKQQAKVKRAIAYDISDVALSKAAELGLETRKIDINNPSDYSRIERADFTILFEILEHIPGSEELLSESWKKSDKGVLFSFPNTGFIIFRFRLFFFGKFPQQWTTHPGEHLRFWTKKDLIWWLRAQGYQSYTIHYYMGIPLLRDLWPNLFAPGLFVFLKK